MNPQTAETSAPALPPPSPETVLDATELELALGSDEIDAGRFETAIRETAEAVGGALLFQMQLGEGEAGRWVAAVAIDGAGEREIAIIDLPCDGGNVSVTPASRSDHPLAGIASAYASLAECWGKAA